VTAVPVAEAARDLGMRPGTLRRLVRDKECPCEQLGRRGRGHAMLVDVDVVRAWLGAGDRDAVILAIAGAAPDLLARATKEAFNLLQGFDKRKAASILAGAWFKHTAALLNYLRSQCPAVPQLEKKPPEIVYLQKIAAGE